MTDVRAPFSSSSAFGRGGRSVLVIAAIALLASLLAAPVPANAAGPAARLRIQNANSHLCLAPAGGSGTLNTQIVQYYCDGYGYRAWQLLDSPGGQGQYYIKNLSSGMCLSPAGGSTGLNALVVQYTCDQHPSRYWVFVGGPGTSPLKNVNSQLCLSPAGGGTGLNTSLVQYTCDQDPSRGWDLFGAYQIANTNSSGLCLTIAGGSSVRNTAAVQYYCDLNVARVWKLPYFDFAHDESSLYLQNVNSGLCLSPAGGGTSPNTLVVQYYCDGNPVRAWHLVPDGAGHSYIQNITSGLCLSPAVDTGLNTTIILYNCDTNPSRLWRVDLV